MKTTLMALTQHDVLFRVLVCPASFGDVFGGRMSSTGGGNLVLHL